MACKCASYDPDSGRFDCSVSGSGCMYLIPNSKRCAVDYGEGPDEDRDRDELIAELEAEKKAQDSESVDYVFDDDDE